MMSGLPGCETTKRWAKAALFDWTVTVQAPCMVMLILFSWGSDNPWARFTAAL
jgi:hypothetical protein